MLDQLAATSWAKPLRQPATRVSVPGGAIFREQNIILSPFEDDGLSRYHAAKLFMGAAAVGPRGLMQADVVLIQAEQKLMQRADQLIVLIDSSKFRATASFVVCDLDAIDVVITDAGITDEEAAMLKAHGIKVIRRHLRDTHASPGVDGSSAERRASLALPDDGVRPHTGEMAPLPIHYNK